MPLPVQDVSQLGIFRTPPLDKAGLFVWAWNKFFQQLERFRQNAPQFFFTAHATRLRLNPQNVATGTLFYENDRNAFYIASPSAWTYFSGVMQTPLDGLPQDLGANDAGFLANVTDYNHVLQWDGSIWQWAAWDTGNGFTKAFVTAPNPLTGWHVADGSTVNLLLSNGGIKPVTAPNVAGAYFRI